MSSRSFLRSIRAAAPVIALAATLPLAGAVSAQAISTEPAPASAPEIDRNMEKAAELEARAWALRDLMDQRSKAANLYRQAAALRPDHDPKKVESLRQASRMHHYADRVNRAADDAAQAARVALRQGDLMEAADAYMDAAWLAGRLGDETRTAQYLEEARLLTNSPLLAHAQREEILRRLEDAV
jgi:hypothetical protein